ncbi:sensor histidine kinase [Nonomuraea sp. LPB2021202275-12-8]|uniref:sensor histidine kinase n=1 Tax=Nonomuraea sp. LPB2021202275-12-8 TaxID=3120159 RepID=UPI00300CD5A6
MITRFGTSVRARLTLFASAAMALLCVVVNSYVLYAVYHATANFQMVTVEDSALRVVHLIERDQLPRVLPAGLVSVQVVDSGGRVTSATGDLAGVPRISTLEPRPDSAKAVREVCDLPGFPGQCNLVLVFRAYQQDGDWLVYSTEKLTPWFVSPAVPAFLIGLSLGLVGLTWFGVSRVVARTLAPVDRIRACLAEISAGGGRGMRVPAPETDDEIRALAVTANQTLERLEAAMEQQRRFAADASHDLRSPITAMRAQIEEALLHPRETDWQRTAREVLSSLDRLQNIVTDLLTVAKLDAGAPATEEPVDLAELVSLETARERSKPVTTTLQPGVVVTGDRLRLARLLTNLLDNAERHAESMIVVVVRKDGQAALEVLDDGAGIAPDQREAVFRRFTRLDASRSRDAGGTGLGLPIAREIAEAHHGTLTIEDSASGARFVLRLPLREG